MHHGDHFSGFLGSIEFSSCPLCTTAQHTGPFKFIHCWLDESGWYKAERKLPRFWCNPLTGFARLPATPHHHTMQLPSKYKCLASQVLVRSSPTPPVSKGEIKKEIAVVGKDTGNRGLPVFLTSCSQLVCV